MFCSTQDQTSYKALPVLHIRLFVYSYSRWCYRKAQVVCGLQQGGHTAHGVHANKKKKTGNPPSIAHRLPCVVAESANISRLSGVKADESHLA